MPAHPHGPRPDPELWRAVHERPAAPTPWPFDRGSPAIAPHGMPADHVARAALHLVELDPDDPRKVTGYSKGMRQRVKVAQALVNDPAVMVLDEPLTGLDPRQRKHLIDLFGRLGAEGRCLVVSSHVLDEVERFGSRVLVIAQGRLAATGDFHAIRDLMDDRPHRILVRTDRPRELARELLGHNGVTAVRLEPGRAGRSPTVVVDTTDAAAFFVAIMIHNLILFSFCRIIDII